MSSAVLRSEMQAVVIGKKDELTNNQSCFVIPEKPEPEKPEIMDAETINKLFDALFAIEEKLKVYNLVFGVNEPLGTEDKNGGSDVLTTAGDMGVNGAGNFETSS